MRIFKSITKYLLSNKRDFTNQLKPRMLLSRSRNDEDKESLDKYISRLFGASWSQRSIHALVIVFDGIIYTLYFIFLVVFG